MTKRTFFWFIIAVTALMIAIICLGYSLQQIVQINGKLDHIVQVLDSWEVEK